jgi:hypothetical protein|tara:strand:- start:556 stop:918 length:363 start_codon:yes stop_codon:yes gene_type:complete
MNKTARKRYLRRMDEIDKEIKHNKDYMERILAKIELKGEDYTCPEQEGHWCLESFGDRPFDSYPDEQDYHVEDRFRRKYKLPFGFLSYLKRRGVLDRYYIDDGTLHLHFNSNCRLGGVTE